MKLARTNGHLSPRGLNPSGFTLTEVMVAMVIGTFILTGILTTYVIAVKGLAGVSNYVEIHADGRYAVDRFAADMRGVNNITSYGASNLVCVVPVAFSSSGAVLSNKTIRYFSNAGAFYRWDSAVGVTNKIAANINQLTFTMYDRLGVPTANLSVAKGIQVDIKLRKMVVNQIQSEDFLSARLWMRNKP